MVHEYCSEIDFKNYHCIADITVQIEGTPEATIVEGGLARMKCIVENIPANAVLAFISWNHDGVIVAADGVIVVADADDDYTITNTVTASRIESDLTIRNIELDEAGTYECVVSFSTPVGDVDVQDSVIVNVEGECSFRSECCWLPDLYIRMEVATNL